MTVTTAAPIAPDEPSSPWGKRVLVGAAVVGVVAVVVGIKMRWWRRGARRTVTKLAEAGAVALADAIVDEMLPAA